MNKKAKKLLFLYIILGIFITILPIYLYFWDWGEIKSDIISSWTSSKIIVNKVKIGDEIRSNIRLLCWAYRTSDILINSVSIRLVKKNIDGLRKDFGDDEKFFLEFLPNIVKSTCSKWDDDLQKEVVNFFCKGLKNKDKVCLKK